MTLEQAKDEIGDNFETFAKHICCQCTANDWFCPSYCDFLRDYHICRLIIFLRNTHIMMGI